jgi:hypothetical protein
MLLWDETFVSATEAAGEEARRAGATAYGSEHMLLGLLAATDPVTNHLTGAEPRLRADTVRDAVHGDAVDQPHLNRLGLDSADLPEHPKVPLQSKHTAEFQVALNESTAKWGALVKSGALPRRRKLGSGELWLAVLQKQARSYRLLETLEIDPEQLRPVVLAAMAGPDRPVPAWPDAVPLGPVSRLFRKLFERTNIAN